MRCRLDDMNVNHYRNQSSSITQTNTCPQCHIEDDLEHYLLTCPAYQQHRHVLYEGLDLIPQEHRQDMDNLDKLKILLYPSTLQYDYHLQFKITTKLLKYINNTQKYQIYKVLDQIKKLRKDYKQNKQ